ncbi:MAG: DNA topoisomerase 3 [Muribaculaceae bacterium]|nr:DNA topoisomerase 3 [Muribaculaceae bacterium]
MRVCITEKPSVARDIAALIGAPTKRDGYFEGKDVCVTWTYGHLCTLKEPADYTDRWKRWSLGALPMIPDKFGIKLIDQESIKRQFAVIKHLVSTADEVVNCGDAGQEGELIQRWVMQKAGVKCPVYRLWISSLTDESIREGFKSLKPQADFDNLYFAGLSRAVGDWILGLNATRLYSLKYSPGGGVLSIGRVQTPTLALIVKRHKEITEFVPEDYWELKTLYRDTTFNSSEGKYKTEESANAAMQAISGQPLEITDVKQKSGREAPPRLFDLTSLQVECNKRWGWTADETLRLIQTLYEKKVTTYPRVDTTYLSEDIYPKVPDILKRMTPYANLTAPVLAAKIPKSKKVFDNAKVTDHHAIIPTGEAPSTLVGDERKMYHLIALRFIAAFYPDCLFDTTTVEATVGKVGFKTSGKVITSPGWRTVLAPSQEDSKNADEEATLPVFTVGESGSHEPSLLKKATQPPKPYTEGSLLRAMESAGKLVEDEILREAMKENGIGRPSTRAAIIETLFKRHYLRRERKNILPTQAGIDLIATINENLLKSAELTGIWENKLRRIERGDFSAGDFIDELKKMIGSIVINVLSDNSSARIEVIRDEDKKSGNATAKKPDAAKKPRKPAIKSLEMIECPLCGKGHLLKGKTAYGCSQFKEGCALRLNFDEYSPDITPAALAKLIKKNFKTSSK